MTDIDTKQARLSQIREQIEEYEHWFHPEPEEVERVLYLAREWAKLDGLAVSQNELVKHWQDSVFPSLVRFCKQELCRLAEYCEQRQADGLGTLPSNIIWIIKQLCIVSIPEEVEQYSVGVEGIFVADILTRIMRTSYRAMYNPGYLTEVILQELRGDILEIVAHTYADIMEIMREQAKKGLEVGLNQVKSSSAAMEIVKKLSSDDEDRMKIRAVELRNKHLDWSIKAIADELHKEFTDLSVSSIRQRSWMKILKKLPKP